MVLQNQEAGPIHQSLVCNSCPKCNAQLETLENTTPDKMVRFCRHCNLTIVDEAEMAECPTKVCD